MMTILRILAPAFAVLAVSFLTAIVAVPVAADACPGSWPGGDRFDGFYTDSDGRRWFVIVSTDSNGYTNGRAYVATDRYRIGYDPSPTYSTTLMRDGVPVAERGCRVDKPPREEPPPPKVVRMVGRAPNNLDPHTANWEGAPYVLEIHSGLTAVSRSMTVEPSLAESWDISGDGRVYTFHLDPAAHFHDGRAITAQDVKFSFERSAAEAYGRQQFFGNVVGFDALTVGQSDALSGVTVIDDLTVRVELVKPSYDFPAPVVLQVDVHRRPPRRGIG